MYGLFAPVHKVTKLASGSAGHVMSASTPSPQTRSLVNTGLRLTRERSGSQESVSSISSTASSVSRSRVRLGVNSLHNQVHAALLMQPFGNIVVSFHVGRAELGHYNFMINGKICICRKIWLTVVSSVLVVKSLFRIYLTKFTSQKL